MARLTMVIDVADLDPAKMDPEVCAGAALDYRYMTGQGKPIELVSAEWVTLIRCPNCNATAPSTDGSITHNIGHQGCEAFQLEMLPWPT